MGETSDLSSMVMDEIALEGLDGITIEGLFKRLVERQDFTSSLNDAYKEYIWEMIVLMGEIDMFELPEPRKPLVIFNRYDFVDPELGMIREPNVVPDEIYPHAPVDDKVNDIRGSCATYYTRVSVNNIASQLTLKEVLDRWGTKIVLVASQKMRNLALMGPSVDPELELTLVQYCLLERIGRSRFLGEVTQGRVSLQIMGEDPKALFYHRKFLMRNGLIVKQVHHQKSGAQNCSGSLLHLPRFYVERVPKVLLLTQRVIQILRTRNHGLAEYEEIRRELGLTGSLKKLFQTAYFQRFARTDLRLPYRQLYPDAKVSEWRSSNNHKEKMLRVVQLLDPNVDPESVSVKDEEEDVEEEEPSSTAPCMDFKKTLNKAFLTQAYECIEQVGVRGYSQLELGRVLGLPKLNSRSVTRNLLKCGLVSTFMNDVGRQRVASFRARKWDEQCTRIRNIERDLQNMRAELLSRALGAGHEVSADDAEEREEGERAAKRPGSPSLLEPPSKVLKADEGQGAVTTSQEESFPQRLENREEIASLSAYMPFVRDQLAPKESWRHRPQSKDTSVITYRIFKRINMILEYVKIHKVVDDHAKFLKLINEEEEREGLNMKMDKKSLLRLLIRLQEDGHLKLFSYLLTAGHKTKTMIFVCDRDVPVDYPSVVSAVEQAKMKLCIVNKGNINLAVAGAVERPVPRRQPGAKKQKVTLVYDMTIGRKYGFCPKFPRMRTLHEFLFYLLYGYEGDPNLDQSKVVPFLQSKDIAVDDGLSSELTQVYSLDINWKMFIPPLPDYSGWPHGWSIMCDVLLRMPLSVFVKIFHVRYVIDGLIAYLQHPVRRHFLVRELPAPMRNGLMALRKYIFSIHEVLQRLCHIGLLQFGPQRLKEKDQVLIFLNRRTTLLDTTSSKPGYHQISDEKYPELKYEFNTVQDLEAYWYNLWNICLHTQLGGRMCVEGKEIVLEQLATKPAMLAAQQPVRPSLAPSRDVGEVPGDRKGAAGLDSAIFAHLKRNWNWVSSAALKQGDFGKKAERRNHQLMNLKTAPVIFTKSTIIVKRSINYLHNGRFLRPERRQLQPAQALPPPGAEVLPKGKPKPRRNIVRRVQARKVGVSNRPYYDNVDLKALQLMSKLRVDWSPEEDIILLLCKVASMYLCPLPRQQTISLSSIRDILHENIPESKNKTSRACQRRILYMIKNLATSNNLAMNLEELKQDEDIVKKFGTPEENARSPNETVKSYEERIHTKFRLLVHELQGRADRLIPTSGAYCTTIPDTVSEFWSTFDVVQPRTAIKYKGSFQDVKNVVDIHCGVVNAIIHSSLCSVADKTSWAYQLFRVYQQYPDTLLRAAIAKIRQDQMASMKKTYSRHTHKGNYLPLSSAPYQLSVTYLQLLQTKYQYSVYHEAFSMLKEIMKGKQSPGGIPVTHVSGGAAAALVELLCKKDITLPIEIPEQVIILDPWMSEKDETFTRIVARYKDILQTCGPDSTTSSLFKRCISEKDDTEEENEESQNSDTLSSEPVDGVSASDEVAGLEMRSGSSKKQARASSPRKKKQKLAISKKSARSESAKEKAVAASVELDKPSSCQELDVVGTEKRDEKQKEESTGNSVERTAAENVQLREESSDSGITLGVVDGAENSEAEKTCSQSLINAGNLPVEPSQAPVSADILGDMEICIEESEEVSVRQVDQRSLVSVEEAEPGDMEICLQESEEVCIKPENHRSPVPVEEAVESGPAVTSGDMETCVEEPGEVSVRPQDHRSLVPVEKAVESEPADTSGDMEICLQESEEVCIKPEDQRSPAPLEESVESMMMSMFAEKELSPSEKRPLDKEMEVDCTSMTVEALTETLTSPGKDKMHGSVQVARELFGMPPESSETSRMEEQGADSLLTAGTLLQGVQAVEGADAQVFASASTEKKINVEGAEVSTPSTRSLFQSVDLKNDQELESVPGRNESAKSCEAAAAMKYIDFCEQTTSNLDSSSSSSSSSVSPLKPSASPQHVLSPATEFSETRLQSSASATEDMSEQAQAPREAPSKEEPPHPHTSSPAPLMPNRPRLSAEVVEFTRALELEVAPSLQEADTEPPSESAEPLMGREPPEPCAEKKLPALEVSNQDLKKNKCSEPFRSSLESVGNKYGALAPLPKKGDGTGKRRKTPPPLLPLSVYLKGTKPCIDDSYSLFQQNSSQALCVKPVSQSLSSEANVLQGRSPSERVEGEKTKGEDPRIVERGPVSSEDFEAKPHGSGDQKMHLSPLPDLVKLESDGSQAAPKETYSVLEPTRTHRKVAMENELSVPVDQKMTVASSVLQEHIDSEHEPQCEQSDGAQMSSAKEKGTPKTSMDVTFQVLACQTSLSSCRNSSVDSKMSSSQSEITVSDSLQPSVNSGGSPLASSLSEGEENVLSSQVCVSDVEQETEVRDEKEMQNKLKAGTTSQFVSAENDPSDGLMRPPLPPVSSSSSKENAHLRSPEEAANFGEMSPEKDRETEEIAARVQCGSVDSVAQDPQSSAVDVQRESSGKSFLTLPLPVFQPSEMKLSNKSPEPVTIQNESNEKIIPLIIISDPSGGKMETEEIPNESFEKLPVIIVSGPSEKRMETEEVLSEVQPAGSSICVDNLLVPPFPLTSPGGEIKDEDALRLLSQVAFESSAVPVTSSVTLGDGESPSTSSQRTAAEKEKEETNSGISLKETPLQAQISAAEDRNGGEMKTDTEEKNETEDDEGRRPSKVMQRTLNQRWRRLEFDWVSDDDWDTLCQETEEAPDRQTEISEDLEEKILLAYAEGGADNEGEEGAGADNEGEEDGAGTYQNHVARAASRIALFMLREEMDESNQMNNKQHAHDFFVVNSCSIFCDLTPELEEIRVKEGPAALQKRLFTLSKETIDGVLADVKSKMIVNMDVDEEGVRAAFLERASPEHWQVVVALVRYVESKRSLGVTLKQLRDHYSHRLTELSLADTLALLCQKGLVVRTGISTLRYVHKRYLRPWLVHTFKFLRLEREKRTPITAKVIQCSDDDEAMDTGDPASSSSEIQGKTVEKRVEEPVSVPDGNEESNEPEKVATGDKLRDCDIDFNTNQGVYLAGGDSTDITEVASAPSGADVQKPSKGENTEEGGALCGGEKGGEELLVCEMPQSGQKRAETADIADRGPVLRSREMRKTAERLDVGDSEPIHVAIRPWIRINGTLNRRVLDRLLGSMLGHAMYLPGQTLDMFGQRFQPALQPVHTRELIEILQKLGCVKLLVQVKKQKVTLFSKPQEIVLREADGTEEDTEIFVEPKVDAICRLGEFIGEKSYGQDFLAAQEQMFAGTGRPGKRKLDDSSGSGRIKKARTYRAPSSPPNANAKGDGITTTRVESDLG